ncbi:MAG TPA: CoA transferase [Solirubrobacteraceae bacterium]|jgi:crotonobetainyl-CoA:carnitine CoA-transferase CaiB-like acyl-CoA transferase|nr:CoA transferase [Solirubrobacteraceae bacterium]
MTGGPLSGLRVLDVSTVLAGPLTCQILGDFGADVIKVEHPQGDSMRGHGRAKDGVSLWWKMISRNKRCVALYLGDPDGAEVFRRLVATADVVVESFRPGTFERWGLGYDALREVNPGLVLVRISGFGQTGPYRERAGFGTLAEAMSGFAAITGEPDGPPTLPPFGLADSIAGMTAANAALMALYHRDARGGAGQQIDVSILEPLVTVLGPQPTIYDQLGEVQQRTGNRSVNNAPRNTYATSDGKWVAVSTSANSVAQRVMRLVGRPELIEEPWFDTGSGRAEHVELLDEIVSEWVGERTRDEVIEAFSDAGAAIAPVYDVADLMADPQILARDAITEVDDPDLGPMRMQNLLFRMSATPGAIRFTGRALGADTDAILGDELGLDVAGLRKRGIVA